MPTVCQLEFSEASPVVKPRLNVEKMIVTTFVNTRNAYTHMKNMESQINENRKLIV